jgi:hypothetical protein
MPDSLLAVAILLVAIVPGFLFLQGYHRGRAQASAPDVFVIAKAAFVSLVFLSLGWAVLWRVGADDEVADLVRKDKLDEHIGLSLGIGWVVFIVAFTGGLASGWAVDWFGRGTVGLRGRIGGFLEWAGFLREETIWARLLEKQFRGPRLIEIRLKDGRTIIGTFDDEASARPDLSEIVLSETFELDEATRQLLPRNRVLYLRGEDIREIATGSSS